jgi:2-oxoisovalerate dehydrogenase E1 component alpha subunit
MGLRLEKNTSHLSRRDLLRDVYQQMLLTYVVDKYALQACQQGQTGFVASCRGHEAVQVGSAICIEVGQDFTLPYYRDLGVVLTIGMTPYEVFRTYFQERAPSVSAEQGAPADRLPPAQAVSHWGYHKHNLVTGPAPVATQILHAAGIAFACKLRKNSAITVAYCGDGATAEADFHEGITFAAQHQLPALFICEQTCADPTTSHLSDFTLPEGLQHVCIDGSDVLAVYEATQEAGARARAGQGPTLLECRVARPLPDGSYADPSRDPLVRCQQLLQAHQCWDEIWACELEARLRREVGQALSDVLRHSS